MAGISEKNRDRKNAAMGKPSLTIEDIACRLIELERKYRLLEVEINGVKIWQAMRMQIFLEIGLKTGCYEVPHTIKDSPLDRFRAVGSFARSILFHNPYFGGGGKEILVFDHNRKVRIRGEFIDVHTKYFIDELLERGVSFEVYERPYMNRHYSKNEPYRRHLDIILILTTLYGVLFPSRIKAADRRFLAQLQSEINSDFHIDIDVLKMFLKEIARFRIKYRLLKALLKKKGAREVYLVVGYGEAPLIKAARDLGIATVEFQHGIFSEYALGYHYPSVPKNLLEYFPDRLYVWDEYWKDMCELPLTDDRIVSYGFQHLQKTREEYSRVSKNEKQIIVISQGIAGPKMSDIILKNIDDLKDYTIVYKLHPGEYDRWRQYKSLVSLSGYDNVKVIDNNEVPLYRLLAESWYLIGLSSTVIFEALSFGCTILLVDLPGIEHMNKLIEAGKAAKIEPDKKIVDYLK